MDPLHDPDDEALLDPRQARDLAGLVENARLASAVVRYGLRTRVGVATVVLNQDNPLPTANHACALWGTLAEVAGTLLELEQVIAAPHVAGSSMDSINNMGIFSARNVVEEKKA